MTHVVYLTYQYIIYYICLQKCQFIVISSWYIYIYRISLFSCPKSEELVRHRVFVGQVGPGWDKFVSLRVFSLPSCVSDVTNDYILFAIPYVRTDLCELIHTTTLRLHLVLTKLSEFKKNPWQINPLARQRGWFSSLTDQTHLWLFDEPSILMFFHLALADTNVAIDRP